MSSTAYPVHVHGRLDPGLSRWLWLVKWLLVLPHYVVLLLLWVAFAVLSVVAFFSILFTGRYPRVVFDFNVGVLRWSWRVAYYAYGALGTDRYPPFTLAEAADYPAHLDIDYPGQLSRGLVLVKWWLLALPHYLVLGFFLSGGVWIGDQATGTDERGWLSGGGLIGLLVLVAAVVLLFTGRYPRSIFDLVLGLNRWVLRVAAYAALMTDDYPPFRLDLGGDDAGSVRVAESPPATTGPDSAPPATTPPPQAGRSPGSHWTAGRVVGLVLASLALVAGLGLLGAGGVLGFGDGFVRGQDGFVTSAPVSVSTQGYAITSEHVALHTPERFADLPRRFMGTTRVSATAVDAPLFVGIARSADARAYLQGVRHATLTDVVPGAGSSRVPVYRDTPGGPPRVAPPEAGIWVEQAVGPDHPTVRWTPEDGDWTVVVMRADGRGSVDAVVTAGARLPVLDTLARVLLWVGAGLLVVGLAGLVLVLRAPRRRPG